MSSIDIQQNAVPTDFSLLDQQMADRSDFNKNRYAGDENRAVQFYMRPQLNERKSMEAGRPIYEDTLYIKIWNAGDKYSVVDRQVGIIENERVRFAKQFAQFQAGQAEQVVGTPITLLPFLTPAQCEELKYYKVRTVEQLAEMADSNGANFLGFHEMKAKARAYLASLTGAPAVLKMQEENAEMKKQMDAMRAALAAQTEQIARLGRGGKSLKEAVNAVPDHADQQPSGDR